MTGAFFKSKDHSLVTSIFLHNCKSWALTSELQRRKAMEMNCYHKILCTTQKDHVTNKEVNAKMKQATGSHEDLLTIAKRRNWSGMDMSPIHQVWPKPSCKAQWKGEEDRADRRRGGKTTSGNGQVWSLSSPRGQWRTENNAKGKWLLSHLWCPNGSRSNGIREVCFPHFEELKKKKIWVIPDSSFPTEGIFLCVQS